MRVLVTGSRDWNSLEVIDEALGDVYAVMGRDVTIVQGGARGADAIAAALAGTRFGWLVENHPADWERYGKRAGFIRNIEMVKAGADVCLAFIKNESRGATHCADAAERAGIPTRRYRA